MEEKQPNAARRASRIGNYAFSGIFIALGILMLVTIYMGDYYLVSQYSLGPGFFPLWIAVLMIVIGVLLVWFTHKGAYDNVSVKLPNGQALVSLALMVLITIVGLLLIQWIGMSVTIAIYFMSVSRFVCRKTWKESILSALVAAVAIYIIFKIGFKVQFPVGIFGF